MSALQQIPAEFLCPITTDVMVDPVMAADGRSYERSAITRWFQNSQRSPMTGEVLPNTGLVSNVNLKALIEDWSVNEGGTTRVGESRIALRDNSFRDSRVNSHNENTALQSSWNSAHRGLTRDLNGGAQSTNWTKIRALQRLGVPFGLAKLLDEEDRRIGMRIYLLDNSGSTCTYDGHYFDSNKDGSLVSVKCSRWAEIKHMALEQAQWNFAMNVPCEFILLNHPEGSFEEGKRYVRIDATIQSQSSAMKRLADMLDRTGPDGSTPLAARVQEIYARVQEERAALAAKGQRVVLVIATDGVPTTASGHHENAKADFVRHLKKLMVDFSVFVVIRLTTDDDDVIGFYDQLDEDLELPLEVIDDIVSEAQQIRQKGNGWLPYSPLIHKIREGGTFIKVFDLLDERKLNSTEFSIVAQLLLRPEGEVATPRDSEELWSILEDLAEEAAEVYDPLRRRMVPPIDVSQAQWALKSPITQLCEAVQDMFSCGPLQMCDGAMDHDKEVELIF